MSYTCDSLPFQTGARMAAIRFSWRKGKLFLLAYVLFLCRFKRVNGHRWFWFPYKNCMRASQNIVSWRYLVWKVIHYLLFAYNPYIIYCYFIAVRFAYRSYSGHVDGGGACFNTEQVYDHSKYICQIGRRQEYGSQSKGSGQKAPRHRRGGRGRRHSHYLSASGSNGRGIRTSMHETRKIGLTTLVLFSRQLRLVDDVRSSLGLSRRNCHKHKFKVTTLHIYIFVCTGCLEKSGKPLEFAENFLYFEKSWGSRGISPF